MGLTVDLPFQSAERSAQGDTYRHREVNALQTGLLLSLVPHF